MKHEKITLIELRRRMEWVMHPSAQAVKFFKLHYAIDRSMGAPPSFEIYAKHLVSLKVFARTEEENKLIDSVLGKGVSMEYPKMVDTLRAAGMDEIADKFQGEWDALNEEVDVKTYQIPVHLFPDSVDGYAYSAFSFIMDKSAQAAE
jgi:hypothetical protein